MGLLTWLFGNEQKRSEPRMRITVDTENETEARRVISNRGLNPDDFIFGNRYVKRKCVVAMTR